jgi:hypothetical protein
LLSISSKPSVRAATAAEDLDGIILFRRDRGCSPATRFRISQVLIIIITMWYDFLLFVVVGFAAQVIDGSIGMAYGLTATTVLLSLGYPPVTASSSTRPDIIVVANASPRRAIPN